MLSGGDKTDLAKLREDYKRDEKVSKQAWRAGRRDGVYEQLQKQKSA
jgi:hypothetical protein